MARKRQIDPGIWLDEAFMELSVPARLLFIGMISLADDEGRLKAGPQYLKAAIFPSDSTTVKHVQGWREEITSTHIAQLYSVDAQTFIWLPKFTEHQYMTRRFPSHIPPPPIINHSLTSPQPVNDVLHGTGTENEVDTENEVGTENDNASAPRKKRQSKKAVAAFTGDFLGLFTPEELEGLALKYPGVDLEFEAKKCWTWWFEGNKPVERPRSSFMNWLGRVRPQERKNGSKSTDGQHSERDWKAIITNPNSKFAGVYSNMPVRPATDADGRTLPDLPVEDMQRGSQ